MEKEKINMNLSEMKVLLIEDDVFKAVDVNKALTFCGIRNIIEVDNQEEAWKVICSSINYNVAEILGTVWYNKLRDLNLDFKELLELHVLNH